MHYWKLPQQSLYIDELVVCILATQIYRWGHACLRLSLLNQNLFICNAAPLEHSHKEEDRAETLQEIKELKRWREGERGMAALMEREALATEARYAPGTYEREVRDDLEVSLPKPCQVVWFSFLLLSYLVPFTTKWNGGLCVDFVDPSFVWSGLMIRPE